MMHLRDEWPGQSSEEYKNGMIHALVRMTFPEKYHQFLVTLILLVGVFSLGVKAQPSSLSKASPVHSYQMWVQLHMMPTYFQYLTVRHDRHSKWGAGNSHLILPITILGILVKKAGLSTHFQQGFSVIVKTTTTTTKNNQQVADHSNADPLQTSWDKIELIISWRSPSIDDC